MLLLTSFSDRYQTRGFPIATVFAVGIVGWSILLGVEPHHATESMLRARYFAVCCVVTAGYSAIPLIMSWQASNVANESQKAVSKTSPISPILLLYHLLPIPITYHPHSPVSSTFSMKNIRTDSFALYRPFSDPLTLLANAFRSSLPSPSQKLPVPDTSKVPGSTSPSKPSVF